ncbi:hypothetical protein WR164_12940 [Philodulcilactobacillus myokoensis]|uniref:Mannosyl-glycoprotein endo-beta-N-acetylglucosamidase-like domain-containing protein n=1 Tax=Philodulcilactobacillus myokoensis TaxID=2929573 RepID=A0A9W6ESZ7_9LACO|nr:glucosaminidase domain-containing protein [Philodulcilactobacillus myokoensis]GLB47315.1 hypothetical protein WR164_12940 [Philodulcilactobacillus myokoensis]
MKKKRNLTLKRRHVADHRKKGSHKHGFVFAVLIIIVVVIGLAAFGIRKINSRINNQNIMTTQNAETSSEIQQRDMEHKFINHISKPAILIYQKNYHVLPSIVIAQAIVESQWGTSKLYQTANNPFGIKGTYQGQYVSYDTDEYVNGKKITVPAKFRKYPNLTEAIADHDHQLQVNFIRGNNTNSYIKAAYLLQRNSYATDPSYAKKLIGVIRQYNLSKYDLEAINND